MPVLETRMRHGWDGIWGAGRVGSTDQCGRFVKTFTKCGRSYSSRNIRESFQELAPGTSSTFVSECWPSRNQGINLVASWPVGNMPRGMFGMRWGMHAAWHVQDALGHACRVACSSPERAPPAPMRVEAHQAGGECSG